MRSRTGPVLSGVLVVGLLAAGASSAGPSGAEAATGGSGAIGQAVSVALGSGPPTTSGPSPEVTLPGSGGQAADAAASVAVGHPGAAGRRARILDTGALAVSTEGSSGPSGATTSSATVADVDALGGTLTSAEVGSTCTTSATESKASSRLTGGELALGPTVRITLPDDPAPGTTFAGTDVDSGEPFTVVLNEQLATSGSFTVTAVHITLGGPSATGEVVLGRSWCAVEGRAPVAASEAATPPAPADRPGPDPAAALTAATPAQAPLGATARTAALAAAPAVAVPAAVPAAVTGVSGGAFGFSASVGLFGGPAGAKGPMPEVTLPAGGADPPLTASAPSGIAQYGPARIFESNELRVSTRGTTGPTGASASSASATDVGPGPITAKTIASTCTASESAKTASATFADGRITTSEGPNKDESTADDTVVPIPSNPAPNTTFEGTVETVGDRFRVVVNEQQVTADAITVNALHLYLLGPVAVGELVIGQSRCARTATAAATGPSSPAASSAGAGAGGAAGAATGSGRVGPGSRSAGRDPLAQTGGSPPVHLALMLLGVGLAARRLRSPPVRGRAHRADGRR